jgi:hypothetical protein
MMAYALTFDELADRVMRITHGIKAECLHYLYEAQRDFVLKAPVVQKTWHKPVTPSTGTITAVADSATPGNAKYAAEAHGLAVDDYVQVYSTALYNGLQQVTVVDDVDNFTTDRDYGAAESGLTATFQYGFMFDLPSDYVDWQRVEWRGCKIRSSHQNDYDYMAQTDGFQLLTGSAYTFWIEGSRLRLVPAPSDDSAIVMAYTYYDTTDAPTSPIIAPIYHQYLMDYAIATMLEVAGDENRANKYWQKYQLALDNVNANRVMSLLS